MQFICRPPRPPSCLGRHLACPKGPKQFTDLRVECVLRAAIEAKSARRRREESGPTSVYFPWEKLRRRGSLGGGGRGEAELGQRERGELNGRRAAVSSCARSLAGSRGICLSFGDGRRRRSRTDGHPSECPEASIGGDVTTRSLSPSSADYVGPTFCFLGIKRKYSCIFF